MASHGLTGHSRPREWAGLASILILVGEWEGHLIHALTRIA